MAVRREMTKAINSCCVMKYSTKVVRSGMNCWTSSSPATVTCCSDTYSESLISNFAQSAGDFLFLCHDRFEIPRSPVRLSFRPGPHVVNIQLFAQLIDPSKQSVLRAGFYRRQMLREKLNESSRFCTLAVRKCRAYRSVFRFQTQTNQGFINLIAAL